VIASNFQIGNTALRPEKFGQEAIKGLEQAVDGSAVRKSKKASLKALQSWSESGTLPQEDFAVLSDYAAASMERYGELEDQWWKLFKAGDTSKAIVKVETNMAREGNLLGRQSKLVTELREATARAAVQAMGGALPGPAGIVAAYAAYANGPTWTNAADRDTKEILESLQSFDSGKSRMLTEGNDVKQVHRDEIWKTMNQTLDKAVADAKAGKPGELDLQYYELTSPEMVGKIADAARAGNTVRLNLDAGRLSFPSKDQDGENYFSLDATPDKIRTILQLASVPNANIAVSLFPQKKLINSPTNLMHRKIMRYKEDTLISGMNANIGSGENVDSGYVVRGPASHNLVENFSRDVQNSKGATLDDIWGADHIAKFEETNLRMGKRGFVSLFDSLGGPSPAGHVLPDPHSLEELEALAEKAGAKLKDLVQVPKADYERVMTRVAERRAEVELSHKGKAMLRKLIEEAIAVTNTEDNLKRLDDITPPSAKKVGSTRVDIADLPIERETLCLQAIAKAEKFIYLPGFVVTTAIAAAIVARRDELKAAGKDLDVRVIADSGIYPAGGTPNSYGVKHLEDNGIQPRWSHLERSNWHDRKIHAKQLITDHGEITGSTNFSNQGLTENWETSAYIHFDDDDPNAAKEREQTKTQFEELWDTSYELNSLDHAAFLNRARAVTPSEYTIEEDRDRSIRATLRNLLNFEKQSAAFFEDLLQNTPAIAKRREELIKEGYAEGSATLMASKEHLGKERYWQMLNELPAAKQLGDAQKDVAEWKAQQTAKAGEGQVKADRDTASALHSPEFRKEDFYIGGLRKKEVAYLHNFG
jgi:hypothetical protein